LITYKTTGKPQEHGVYACRVNGSVGGKATVEDKFLSWTGERGWYHCGSDQRFRGQVLGYIGPLQRKLPAQFAKF